MRNIWILTVLGGLFLANPQVSAQPAFPSKAIRLIVPYPPGAGNDFTAREVAAHFSNALGQQVVVDNRPGAAATLGHALVAKAQPDGYTLLLATAGGLVSGPALMGSKVPYDPTKDFEPIGLATYVAYGLAVTANLPTRGIKDLIDFAKAHPGVCRVFAICGGQPLRVQCALHKVRSPAFPYCRAAGPAPSLPHAPPLACARATPSPGWRSPSTCRRRTTF
jgi:tripartite-type tricarboxylate transporter receptor subunit TctC